MLHEKRKSPRFKIEQMVEISPGKESYIQARGLNISMHGLFCTTEDQIEPSSRIFLMIMLDDDEVIRSEGTVVRNDRVAGKNHLAIEFNSMDAIDQAKLQSFLQKLSL